MPGGAVPGRHGARGRDLTQGPIGKTLLLFALPTLGSNILQSLNGSINAIWVGRFLGEDALAATANGNILMFLLLAFVFGFGMAGTILIGQAFGRRDIQEARKVMGTTIGSFMTVLIAISVIGWLFAPQFLRVLATPPDALPLAIAYLRTVFLALPAGLMMALLMMALRGAGDALTPLWFMLMSVLLDSSLNPVFILGLGPAPRLGIAGAGTATAIANYTSLAAMLIYIYAKDLPLRLRGPDLHYLKPDWALLGLIIRKGFPMGLQMIVISSSALAMLGLVNREGVVTTAAYAVAQQLWTYVQMPAMALGAAVSAMAAQNIGAGNWNRISQITRSGVMFNIVLTGSVVLLLTFFDRPALELFLGPNSTALPIARHIQLVATWGFVFFGISLVLFGTVRANGVVVWPLIILFIAMYPVRFGVVFGTDQWIGTDALWLSFPAGMCATMVMAFALYLHPGWRRHGLVHEVAEEECVELAQADAEPGGSFNPRG
ncbi:MAG: MATE family efflux transporter [Sphingomonadales bacterium]